jgi:hypothetical protein
LYTVRDNEKTAADLCRFNITTGKLSKIKNKLHIFLKINFRVLLHISTDIGKVDFTFLKLILKNGSNRSKEVISEAFALVESVEFAQFSK